jgi:hypothetical protein
MGGVVEEVAMSEEPERQCEVVTRTGKRCFNDAEPDTTWCIAHLALGASTIEAEWTGPLPEGGVKLVQERFPSAS